MSPRRRLDDRALLALGVVLTIVGVGGGILFLMQPWRSCDYGESGDCHALPSDAVALLIATVTALVGLFILLVAVLRVLGPAPTDRIVEWGGRARTTRRTRRR